jgi:hypothetical protein
MAMTTRGSDTGDLRDPVLFNRRSPATENSHLALAERHISEVKAHVARQREVIEYLKAAGHDFDLAVSMLDALETSLRVFEHHRDLILDRTSCRRDQRTRRRVKRKRDKPVDVSGPESEAPHPQSRS